MSFGVLVVLCCCWVAGLDKKEKEANNWCSSLTFCVNSVIRFKLAICNFLLLKEYLFSLLIDKGWFMDDVN